MSSKTPNYKRTKFACYAAYFTMALLFLVSAVRYVICYFKKQGEIA